MTWHLQPCARLADHAQDWDRLNQQGANLPFLETAFLLPLLQVFGTGNELLAWHEGPAGWDAAALLRRSGQGRWETFQPSQLPLGPWLCTPGTAVAPALHSLMKALPGLALGLGLTQQDPRLAPRPDDAPAMGTLDYIRTSYLNISGSFDDYWEARGKNLKQNGRKQRNRLQADGVQVRLECVSDPAGVADAIVQFGALESAGWKAESGTAIHADNDQGRFYRQMMQAFCTLERGRIYRYWFNDAVVAMDLCIDSGPVVVILKTAYDEQHKQHSPSMLMRQDQFAAWWAEGRYQRIEFYGKTLEWHTRFTTTEVGLYHATAYRWGWLAALQARRRSKAASTPTVSDAASAS